MKTFRLRWPDLPESEQSRLSREKDQLSPEKVSRNALIDVAYKQAEIFARLCGTQVDPNLRAKLEALLDAPVEEIGDSPIAKALR